jgi:hypothetical protein
VAALFALDRGPDTGWTSPAVLALVVASPALLAVFAWVERRAGGSALLPPDVLGSRRFRMVCLSVLLMSPSFFAALVYLPQYVQKILGYSALCSGAGLLPLMVVFGAVSFWAGWLYDRVGAGPVVSVGALLIGGGLLLTSLAGAGSQYGVLVPGMVAMGIGIGLYYSSVTTAAVTAVDHSRASLAGAIVYMVQVGGGSIGLGLTTAIFSDVSSRHLMTDATEAGIAADPRDLDAVHGVLAGTPSAANALASFPAQVAQELTSLAGDAFVTGMQWAFRVDGLLALGGFLVAIRAVGRPLGAWRAQRASQP